MPGEDDVASASISNQTQLTACRRCRKQKLRCTKEMPICRRCRDIGAVCDYPPPPDRKALAAKRAQSARTRDGNADLSAASPQWSAESVLSESRSPMTRDSKYTQQYNQNTASITTATANLSSSSLTTALDQAMMPEPALAAYLMDIYFEKMYFSTLLFHKPSFLKAYHLGKVEKSLVFSMFALAAIFMSTPSSRATLLRRNMDCGISLAALESAADNAFQWATWASQAILMNCDQPRPEVVQGCQNLAIFWLSQGQANRTNIQQHIAYRSSRLLGFHRWSPDRGLASNYMQSEMERRIFWATWISHCISQDNSTFKTDCWKDAVMLPLPSDEDSFESGQPILQDVFDRNGHLLSPPLLQAETGTRKLSPLAEMSKLIGLWWEIQSLVKKYAAEGQEASSKNVAAMQEVDHRLDLAEEQLDPNKSFKVPTVGAHNEQYLLTAVHCLYHLCGCTLSSALIPLFSNVPAKISAGIMSKKMSRIIAQDAIGHALALLAIGSDFVRNGADISRLPSMTGFSMFVACTIYFKALFAQGKLRSQTLDRIRPAVIILEELQQYWQRLRQPWQSLETLLRSHGFRLDTYQNLNSGTQTPAEPVTKIDQIVLHDPLPEKGPTSRIYTFHESEETINERPRPSIAFLLHDETPQQSLASTDKHFMSGFHGVSSNFPSSDLSNKRCNTDDHNPQQSELDGLTTQSQPPLPLPTAPIFSHNFETITASEPFTYGHHMMDLDGADLWWDQTFEFVTDGFQLGGWPPSL